MDCNGDDLLKDISFNDTIFLTSQNQNNDDNNCAQEIFDEPKKNVDVCNEYVNCTVEKKLLTSLKLNSSLSSWGLPDSVLSKYNERGVFNMFDWQVECLGNEKVLEQNCNLVYSAPTSAGKTLVAEILALKTVLEKHKKVLVILPFVSVVREKMFYFQDILSTSGIRAEGFMGSHTPPGGFKAVQLAVCTIEKANSIVNKLLEDGLLGDIGSVIVDEMHLLGDPSRGYLLELLLTKLRYMSIKNKEINIQLIGMSATLPNLIILSKWLNAELYTTNFRPIPLYEFCLVSGEMYNNEMKLHRTLERNPDLQEDTDNILQLCLETISSSCSVLIFCPTKNWCENLAQQISVAFFKLGRSKSDLGQCLKEQLNSDRIAEILEQLKRCPVGLDSILMKTISFGVSFHHAGLTMDERDIIESAFRNGALRVLIATSTLSSGVNLPAQRVIVRTPMFHGKPIDSLTFRQMIGRAGRMGKDKSGESILICQKNDRKIAGSLMSAKLQPIESCLEGAGKLKRAILEVVASGVATTPDDIKLFADCTLLAASTDGNLSDDNPIEKALEFLVKNEFIRLQSNEQNELKYVATSLAKACLSSSLPPEEGLALFEEIERARQCFVLDTDLHLLYLVTPYSVCNQWTNLDWMLYLHIWEKLPPSMKKVAELVGVRESYIVNSTRGKINASTSKLYHMLQIHRRFYTALALQDLVNEISLNAVAEKFHCSRGMLQSLQQSASMFAGMVTSFCAQLRWKSFEILISQFQDRLQFGIQHELLDLMKLPALNGPRARALYNVGIESLTDLASFDVCKLENVLHASIPFQSEKEREGETAFDVEQKKKLRGIWITGKEGLTAWEAAQMLIKDARRYLQLEIGAAVMKWDVDPTNSETNNTLSHDDNNSQQEIVDSNYNSDCSYLKESPKENIEDNNSLVGSKSESVSNQKNYEDNFSLRVCSNKNSIETNGITSQLNEVDLIKTSILKLSNISNSMPVENKSQSKTFEEGTNSVKTTNQILQVDIIEIPTLILPKDNNSTSPKNRCVSEFNSTLSSNNSLFEDSFCLDANLCNALDDYVQVNNNCSLENSIELIMNETSFFDNVDKKLTEENKENVALNASDNLSDVVDSSQSEHNKHLTLLSPMYDSGRKQRLSSFKRTPIKRQRNNENCNSAIIEGTPKKRKKLLEEIETDCVLSVNLETLDIIDVCKSKDLFDAFRKEVKTKPILSISIACEHFEEEKLRIGQKIINPNTVKETVQKDQIFVGKRLISGLALSWGENTVCYLSFSNSEFVSNSEKIKLIETLFENENLVVRIFDYKEQYRLLHNFSGIVLDCWVEDPKVADWLLEPEGHQKNLQAMALRYSPEALGVAKLAGSCKGLTSIALDVRSAVLSRIRASVEALVTWHVVDAQKKILKEENCKLLETFRTEMKCMSCLAQMEILGLRVDKSKLNNLITTIQEQMETLQQQAFQLAGRRFSFTSSKEVAKVLGIYKGKRVTTNKQTLEQCNKPISNIILQWRKLSCTLTKMLFPIMRSLIEDRIHGCFETHTSTGRITMHEPNLQNVPRNFEITTNDKIISFSVRAVFIPTNERIFLSVDFCQLELRLLAHLSKDLTLCATLRTNEDVFTIIAAKLNKISENEVTERLRQNAKQLCYGIIYGMGTKALAEQLKSTEEEALEFMHNFKDTYPQIKVYMQEIVSLCKEQGFIETLAGRRRYLPHINSENAIEKCQAERQALNTTIQGSAADLAKLALVQVEAKLRKYFPSSNPHKSRIALILHIHDEQIFEIPCNELNSVAHVIKNTMEHAVELSIPFPVKLKVGPSWGHLEEMNCL